MLVSDGLQKMLLEDVDPGVGLEHKYAVGRQQFAYTVGYIVQVIHVGIGEIAYDHRGRAALRFDLASEFGSEKIRDGFNTHLRGCRSQILRRFNPQHRHATLSEEVYEDPIVAS